MAFIRKKGKTALVLAGGGVTGAVYEIGALRAINDLLVDRTVNDFDIYVGTSSGALVAFLLANGMSPEDMLQVIEGSNTGMAVIDHRDIFNINRGDLINRSIKLPKTLVSSCLQFLRQANTMTLFDLVWSLADALPAGLYDGLALERFLRLTLKRLGFTNSFSELARELYIIATDLDSGERVVFGDGEYKDTPVSLAVAASSALPILYKPVRIGGRDYVDGGLRGNASLDLAIERGAKLVVCINPMVPFDNKRDNSPSPSALEGENLSERGVQSIANQSIRILMHAGLHYHIKHLRRLHPEVDFILIEPRPEDHQMFFYNIMHYSARLVVARYGFESVTLDLAEDYANYKQILAWHGIPLSRRLVIEEMAEIVNSNYDPKVIRKVLEARSPGCNSRRRNTPLCQINRMLAELELALDEIAD